MLGASQPGIVTIITKMATPLLPDNRSCSYPSMDITPSSNRPCLQLAVAVSTAIRKGHFR